MKETLVAAVEQAENLFRERYPDIQGRVALNIGAFLDFREGALFVTSVDSGGDKSLHWSKDPGSLLSVAQALPRLGSQLKTRQDTPQDLQLTLALEALNSFLEEVSNESD